MQKKSADEYFINFIVQRHARESGHNCTESETQERRISLPGGREGRERPELCEGGERSVLYLSLLASRSDSRRVRMSPSLTGP